MINPIDSSKEELFSYEMDFAKLRFITVSFDGPGQGETYVFHGHKATRTLWGLFVDEVIQFAADRFPDLPIHLFGTSSGANWAIHGSSHPKAGRVAAVSPAFDNQVKMPDYFRERLSYILDDSESMLLPSLNNFEPFSPIILFHGNKDVMVHDEDVYELYRNLPPEKRLIEYENEGHCCNFKLAEIRQLSAEWYGGLTYDV
jgi:alpha-beta hydrolase superfamily lysophospholipase